MRSAAYNTACRAINTVSFCLVAVLAFLVHESSPANRQGKLDSSDLFTTRDGVFNAMSDRELPPIIWMEPNSDLITCEALVRRLEGLRLTAYQDARSAGSKRWSIGYGRAHGVYPGMTITKAEAEQFLREDVAVAREAVRKSVEGMVSRQQSEALCSLALNIGSSAFARSTLVRRIQEGNHEAAQAEFSQWIRAGTVKPLGLKIRRNVEAAVFAL